MSKPPKISIIMPTYNASRFLPAAIESVLSQAFDDWELIIADDCSTDNSREIIQFYYNDLHSRFRKRIVFIKNTLNMGLVENTSWALGLASGEYIKFLDSDDILWPGALFDMVRMLDTYPTAALVTGKRVTIDENGDYIDRMGQVYPPAMNSSHLIPGQEAINKCLLHGNLIGNPSAVMARRSMLRFMNPKYQHLCDLKMMLDTLMHGDLVVFPLEVCKYRIHGKQSSHTATIALPFATDYARLMKEMLPVSTLSFWQRQYAKARCVYMVFDVWRRKRLYSFPRMVREVVAQFWRVFIK